MVEHECDSPNALVVRVPQQGHEQYASMVQKSSASVSSGMLGAIQVAPETRLKTDFPLANKRVNG